MSSYGCRMLAVALNERKQQISDGADHAGEGMIHLGRHEGRRRYEDGQRRDRLERIRLVRDTDLMSDPAHRCKRDIDQKHCDDHGGRELASQDQSLGG